MADLRVIRTEKAIQAAFVKLVNEVGFEDVTVTSLAQEAMINRLTFYKHYTDKYDLAQSMIEHFGTLYEHVIQKRLTFTENNYSFKKVLEEQLTPDLTALFLNKQDELRALQSIQVGSLTLNKKLESVIAKYMPRLLHHDVSKLEQRLLVALLANILNYVIEEQHLPDYRELQQTLKDVQRVIE